MKTADAFVAAVAATIRRRGLLKGGEHVLLGVSGGPDSLALLYAFHALAPTLGLTLHVAHFDHRWREGSAADARFVQRHADRLGIGCTVGEAESPDRLPGRSPEESARIRRLSFFSTVAKTWGATRIATGHTLDDQAETVLMRVLTGAGKRGLSGIPPVRWYAIRPLIDVRRADTVAYCKALKLRPLRDPSNDDLSLVRNRIRLRTLPALREQFNGRLDEQLARMADLERDEDYYLDQQASLLAKPEQTADGGRVKIDTLASLPVALQRRVVRLLARNEGPGINAEHTEAVRALALAGRTGASLDLPGSLTARVEYGFLVVGIEQSKPLAREQTELTVPGETELVSWDLRVLGSIASDRPAAWPDGEQRCVLDADRITFPLRVRRWRTGDAFRPLGMSRRKKVGDFFTDERVPSRKRREVPLIVGEDGSIVWVVGHRIDDRVKVSDATRSFLWLSVEGD